MSRKVHRLPDVDQVAREASEWIARLNAEDCSPTDREDFAEWRTAHVLHGRVYDELLSTWTAFTSVGPVVRAVAFGQSINQVTPDSLPSRKLRILLPAGAAAVALISLVLFFLRRTDEGVFQTSVGEHAAISLPDGSTFELNSNSVAKVAYTRSERVIKLERGEAYFKVLPDSARPFWVIGGGSIVRAVGTAFDVYIRPDDVQITVSEGTIKVRRTEGSSAAGPSDEALTDLSAAVISKGEQAELHGLSTEIRSVEPEELARYSLWRTGSIYFENQPLSAVVDELGRYTTLKMVVSNESARQLHVGGTFRASPAGAEALLTMLSDGFGLNIRRDGDAVYIADPRHHGSR